MNYAQFLGLPSMGTTRKGVAIPGDLSEEISVWLQPARPASSGESKPVVSLQNAKGDTIQYITLPALDVQDPENGPSSCENRGGDAVQTPIKLGG